MRSAFFKAYESLLAQQELSSDTAQRAAARALDDLATNLKKQKGWGWRLFLPRLSPARARQAKNLYLWGGVGRGKTMLMDLFFDHLSVAKKRRLHFIEFMKETHTTLKRLRKEQAGDVVQPLAAEMRAKWDVLCLDEFQVNDIADASILGRLFAALFEEELVVVATSNRAPDELYWEGLNRARFLPFIELLKERAIVLPLGHGKDYRRDAMEGFERYYTNESRALYDKFEKLTHGQSKPHHLENDGRTLLVPQQAFGCALFQFDDLCKQPLGANDYLLLAHTYHTIFIDSIPQLDKTKRNETKRFIHLIDVLYDNRILLIANAATRPAALYQRNKQSLESTESFEFERTASRLEEMQSPDYLPKGEARAVEAK